MVFRMPTFLQWPKITYKKLDVLLGAHSMVYFVFCYYVYFIILSSHHSLSEGSSLLCW